MVAILHFHIHESTFYINNHHLKHGYIENYLEPYSRFMAFSGYTIVMVSYFLIGLKGLSKAKLYQLLIVSLFGALFVFLNFATSGLEALEWDIYPFVAASSLVIAALTKRPLLLYALSFVGGVLMLLPPHTWDFPNLQTQFYYNALFGDYVSEGKGSWPLIPWLGLPLAAYSCGHILRQSQKVRRLLERIKPLELLLWSFILICCSPYWGHFFEIPVGPGFYKFAHTMGRVPLFAHLIPVIFCIRIGFLKSMNEAVARNRYLNWVSRLYLNRRFFLYYLISWGLIGIFSSFEDFYLQHPGSFDWVFFGLFPLCELCCSVTEKALSRQKFGFTKKLRAAP